MQDILKEYGQAIITFVAIVALIGLVVLLIGNNSEDSVVARAFIGLIDRFFSVASQGIDGSSAARAASDAAAAAAGGGM